MISSESTTKLLIYIPAALLTLVVLVFACFFIFDNYMDLSAKEPVQVKTFVSDKKIYGSREDIKFSLKVKVLQPVEATVYIRGVKPYSHYYIDLKEDISLQEGDNTFNIAGITPSCTSGCGGVSPGIYDVELGIRDAQNVLLASRLTKIELTSN